MDDLEVELTLTQLCEARSRASAVNALVATLEKMLADDGIEFKVNMAGASWKRGAALETRTDAVPEGHFKRGDWDRFICGNCGTTYDKHLHTDEASLCPAPNRGSGT